MQESGRSGSSPPHGKSQSRPKLDALRQRKLLREIHRRRLPAHVGFPRVTAALASAARFFFPAKGAADFRAAGADVHVREATVAAARVVGGVQDLGKKPRGETARRSQAGARQGYPPSR